MSTVVVYATRYGCTARCALGLATRIPGATAVDLGSGRSAVLAAVAAADTIVVGGPIYAGRILGTVARFCERHRELLLARRVGLFITCLERGERAREELEAAFPSWLSARALSRRILGGEARPGSMRGLDRFLFRKVAGQTADVLRVDTGQIDALAQEMR